MCLSTVSQINKKPNYTIKHGWKLFKVKDGQLKFQYRSISGKRCNQTHNDNVPINQWLNRTVGRIFSNVDHRFYPKGFHVFSSRRECRSMKQYNTIVKKVKVNGVLAEGVDTYRNVLICDKILVCP